MAYPHSSHLFCLQLCSDIVNGLILAVFIAVVKASYYDKSVILCTREAFSPLQLHVLYQEIVPCQSCIDLLLDIR